MVADRNPQVEKAVVKLRKLSADEIARDMYERREKARRDQASLVKDGEERGRRKGRKEGMLEGRKDMAKNLMGLGVPIEKIMQASNLTREEVEALR